MKRSGHYLALLSASLLLSGGVGEPVFANEKQPRELLIARAEALPVENFDHANDVYLEGYIQALLDMHYYEQRVIVAVRDHNVILSNLPKNALLANSIICFVKDLPDVESVEVQDEVSVEEAAIRNKYVEKPQVGGVWFPQSTVLFPPLVADPREPCYSVNYRVDDRIMGRKAVAVSLGDEFPFFRWRDVWRWHGDLQIGVQAGVWAVFNFDHVSHKQGDGMCELMNTDYLVGIPLSYAVDRWAFRARIYHISGHLGDEFLVNHPKFLDRRKNPSYEAVDFFTSYQFTKGFRMYVGPGVILHSDPSFPLDTFYVQYGMELRVLGCRLPYHKLYGTPFLAIHLENWQVHDWNLDTFAKLGYEWSKLQGIGRKVRVYLGYHNGYSYEGQFFRRRAKYGELGLSWGF